MLSDTFVFRPSARIGMLLAAGALICISGALIIPIPPPMRAVAAAVLAAAFWREWRRYARHRGAHIAYGIRLNKDSSVTIFDKKDTPTDGGYIVSRFVSPFLSVAVIRGGLRPYKILVMSDSLPPEDFRRLRLRLRLAIPNRPHPYAVFFPPYPYAPLPPLPAEMPVWRRLAAQFAPYEPEKWQRRRWW